MSQITLPLDIKSLEVISQRIDSEENIVFEVKSKNDHSDIGADFWTGKRLF